MKKLLTLCLLATWFLLGAAQTGTLQGKRMVVFGDSYVANHREPKENTWHYKFAKKHGMDYVNFGRNGNCVALDRSRFGEAMYKRYHQLPDSIDLLIMIAGHNDASLLDSIGIDNYRLRLGELCDSLVERYPTANILFFTPWNGKDFETNNFHKIIDATLGVCGARSIPVFDAARNGNIFSNSDKFRSIYFQNGGVNDRAHLNAKGHDRFLPVAEAFILSHIQFEPAKETDTDTTQGGL